MTKDTNVVESFPRRIDSSPLPLVTRRQSGIYYFIDFTVTMNIIPRASILWVTLLALFVGSCAAEDNVTAPSQSPSMTFAPTIDNSTAITDAPSSQPTAANVTSLAPSSAPTAAGGTSAPSIVPVSPTVAPVPTAAPSAQKSEPAAPTHHWSFFRFIEKTIAWCIILVLSLLAFGAIMANRYRIFFFLRGVWYTILRMECTGWVLRKLRLGDYQPVDQSLNTVIFENEMDQGLLMRETDA